MKSEELILALAIVVVLAVLYIVGAPLLPVPIGGVP